jgi:hypothetical protein
MVAFFLGARMDTAIFLNKLDSQSREKLFSMQAGPDKQALYLLNLYESDAPQLAKDCRDFCQDLQDEDGTEYWREVCACIARLMVKH